MPETLRTIRRVSTRGQSLVAVTFDPTASGDDTESDEGDPLTRLDKAFADREEQIVRMSSVAASDATTRIPKETKSEMEEMIWKEM